MTLKCSECGSKMKILDKKVFPCAVCMLINGKEIWFGKHEGTGLVDIGIFTASRFQEHYQASPFGCTIAINYEKQNLKLRDIIHYKAFTHGDPEFKVKVIDLLTQQKGSFEISAVEILDIIKK